MWLIFFSKVTTQFACIQFQHGYRLSGHPGGEDRGRRAEFGSLNGLDLAFRCVEEFICP